MVGHAETKCVWGGGTVKSDIVEVSASSITARIGKNNSLENIQSYWFNNPVPDGKIPAKTDQD